MTRQATLESQVCSFDPAERRSALDRLLDAGRGGLPAEGTNVNLHFHTFFSYNAENWSPSRVAWESRKAGLYAAAICDFDVLDGMEEFLDSGLRAGLRAAVHVETRVYVQELASVDISSPGEPGVTYIMGAGFAGTPAAGSPQATGADRLRAGARERNLALLRRVNAKLPEITLDYDRDVVPLTPSGNATERHIISAYLNRAKSVYANPHAVAGYLSGVLGRPMEEVVDLLADTPALEEALRSRLIKKGGVCYEQPSPGTFPPVDVFVAWVKSCGAIPMVTWLDGTSGGEKDPNALLDLMLAKGCAALNIIPDRNWNIKDPAARAVKRANLKAIVEAADARRLPINVGTEMNKLGLPFVDDLAGEVLGAYRGQFLRGARIMIGHTNLLRYAGYGYTGEAARGDFRSADDRNAFFEAVGALPPMAAAEAGMLRQRGPAGALDWFRQAVRKV
jgi:hypothetical protein